MKCRIEKDNLGQKNVPLEAYYGIGTLRSKETFQITKHVLSRQMIKSLALVKKVSAKTNGIMNFISKEVEEAISYSADEILNGRLHGQFITDILQDGYGYGMDINACEVICNRANEKLGSSKGFYDLCKLSEVSLHQDVRETVVLAGKLTTVKLAKKLIAENKKTCNVIKKKLQNSLLDKKSLTYMQLASVYEILERDTKRVDKAVSNLCTISYGQYMELNDLDKEKYLNTYIKILNEEVSEKYTLSENYYTTSNNLDCFMNVSATIKNLMVNFSKCAGDLKEITKDLKIIFPEVQDINVSKEDVLFDFVKQVSFYIVGNDLTVSRTVESGVLNDNPFIPIVLASLFESTNLVRRTIRTIKEKVFETMIIKQ